jgi:hypothetical protein
MTQKGKMLGAEKLAHLAASAWGLQRRYEERAAILRKVGVKIEPYGDLPPYFQRIMDAYATARASGAPSKERMERTLKVAQVELPNIVCLGKGKAALQGRFLAKAFPTLWRYRWREALGQEKP